MHVLVVSSLYLREGKITGAQIHRQCVELRRLGVDVTVICPLPKLTRPLSISKVLRAVPIQRLVDGIPVTYLPYANVPHALSADLDVASLHRSLRERINALGASRSVDVIHAHRLFPTAAAALSHARRLGVPFVASARGSDVHTNPHRNGGIARLTRWVMRGSTALVAVSQALAREMRALGLGSPGRAIDVVYNGVDTDLFRPSCDIRGLRSRLGLPQEGVGVCTVGRLTAEKGVFDLLGAFERLAREFPSLWLCFVGGGEAEKVLRLRASQARLADRVFFAGPQRHKEVAQWLSTADVFALPSYGEGMPNALLEAMACALPAVSTRVGGVQEALDSECGILCPRNDLGSLVQALRTLVSSQSLRRQMGTAGRQRVQNEFSWARSGEALRSVYARAVETDTYSLGNHRFADN